MLFYYITITTYYIYTNLSILLFVNLVIYHVVDYYKALKIFIKSVLNFKVRTSTVYYIMLT